MDVPAGKEHWIGIVLHVPQGTMQGTYLLLVKAICRRHPDVTAEAVFPVQVGGQ